MAVRSTTKPKTTTKAAPTPHSAKKKSAAVLVNDELACYRSIRDFSVMAELMGGAATSGAATSRARAVDDESSRGLRFVIQKHAATRLHYDFRLEWNGVLKSWAVTKGPSFYPGDKRLAVQVEDHPLEYGGFEGIIPKGQYGGGTVMVWDEGTWLPHGDADEGLERGHLTFELHGQKLKGSWALIRMRARPQDMGKANWLLLKEHDPEEYAEGDTPITESAPYSALTGRDMDEIAGDRDCVWNSNDYPSAPTDDPLAPIYDAIAPVDDETAPFVEQANRQGRKKMSHLSASKGFAEQSQARYQVRLTHPDKQIDAASKLTKQQLADYYSAVADAMLPYIANRPLSIVRCPQGSAGPCFFQKHLVEGLPPGIDGVMIQSRKGGEPEEYITLSTGEALVGLAQLGVLEIHPWGSTNSDLEHPDRIIFDLDPDPSLPWATLAGAALEVRERLKKLGLASFVKSTGGKGLHVVAPIEQHHGWPAVKAFAKSVAQAMAAHNPQLYLMTMTKAERKGRIYVDYLRNERGATAIAPYSPRARAGVPVAVPLAWKEMEAAARPMFAVADFPSWEARLKRDPWAQMLSTGQTLPIG
ncbi:MAG: non-homologous end-joining DNA ligase [Acidobacteriaceae bacterium]